MSAWGSFQPRGVSGRGIEEGTTKRANNTFGGCNKIII